MLNRYNIKIEKFGELSELYDQERDVIVVGQLDGEDVCIRFFCPCEDCVPIYIPFGEYNNEKGSSVPRTLEWSEKNKVLSINPSIEVKAKCGCHFYIKNNKVNMC